jgi:hypothetical protein
MMSGRSSRRSLWVASGSERLVQVRAMRRNSAQVGAARMVVFPRHHERCVSRTATSASPSVRMKPVPPSVPFGEVGKVTW